MTYWIQHGYGKGRKLATVADTGLLTGVILSPGDEDRSSLESTVETVHGYGADALLDPQLYVYTIPGGFARQHRFHGLAFGDISWHVSPSQIARQVAAIVAANQQLGIKSVVAPSPYQSSFGEEWSPVSIQYARATIDSTDPPVYVSLIAEASAFADWSQTARYLEVLTTLDAQGIYLVVGTPSRTYPFIWDSPQLTNILRVIHTLAHFNEYKVIWGYSDIAGLLGLVCGATGAATGWYHSLRMWTRDKWIPKSGGQQAIPRIVVDPLLSVIQRNQEAVSIAQSRLASRVFPDLDDRNQLRSNVPWSIRDSWNQYLVAIARLHEEIDQSSSIGDRVESFSQRLRLATNLFADMRDAEIVVSTVYASAVACMIEALDSFAVQEDL